MNKIFKIVWNAARGKMMVVNETTSSVQTGKKAAVTVAVMGALVAGSAMADTIPSDPIVVTSGSGFNAENRVLTLSGDGSDTLAIQLNGEYVQALRSYAGEFTINKIDKLSITGYSGNQNAIHIQAPTSSSYSYQGKMTISNVGTVEIGTEENPIKVFTAINVMGGTLDVKVDKFSVYASSGNAIWSQQTTNTYPAIVNIEAKEINLHTSSTTIGATIFGDSDDASENASSLTLKADKLSIVSTASNAVSMYDKWEGDNHEGQTAIQLSGKTSVNIEGKKNGLNIDRQVATGASSGLSVVSEGTINISGEENAVNISGVNDDADVSAQITAPTIELDGNVTLAGAKASLGLEGTATINGDVSADGSTLDVEGEAIFNGNADIGTLTGDNAKLTLGDAESTVKVGTNSASSTTLGATGEVNDALGGDVSQLADNFVGFEDGTQIQMAEGDVMGAVSATLDGEGVSGVTVAVNEKTEALAEQVTLAPQMIQRIMMNDVRKRMGDLRAAEGTHGVWARYNGGQLAGSGMEADFNMVQVGIDTVPVVDAPRFGVAFSYAQTEADATNGLATTDMDAFSLAFYGTKMYDNGMFVDVIGRIATVDTEMTVQGNKAEMDNVALSLSGELGWRFDVTDQFFIEPSAELTYTYTNADTFKMGQGTYELESVDSLVGRAGFAAGFKCPANKGDVYVRAAVVHEFMGDSTMNSMVNGRSAKPVESDGEDTYFEYAIGAQFNVNKNTYVYADIERTEGAALDEDWRANVGVRFAF